MTVPAAKVWKAVEGIGGLDVWFPSLTTCTIEGSGVGAIRRMGSARGGMIVDHVIELQPDKMRLSYRRVESPFAVTSYVGTVEVFESFDGLGILCWTIDFESTPENAPIVNGQLETGIGAGVEGMRDDLAKSIYHALPFPEVR
jgi:hypothetical protein